MFIGSTLQYSLPQTEDRERLETVARASWKGGEIPDFIIFNGQSFVIMPYSQDDAGMYPIDIELTDRFSPPRFYIFLVTVLKTPPKKA
jgi:hypothetical protein